MRGNITTGEWVGVGMGARGRGTKCWLAAVRTRSMHAICNPWHIFRVVWTCHSWFHMSVTLSPFLFLAHYQADLPGVLPHPL